MNPHPHTAGPGCRCPRRECVASRRTRREAHRDALAGMPVGLRRAAAEPPADASRSVAPKARKGAAQGKRRRSGRMESATWLAWVRTLPCALGEGLCVVCLGHVQPHHVRTRGAGGPDFTAIPLCAGAHDLVHRGRIPRDRIVQALGETLLLAARQPRAWWARVLGEIATDER